MTTPTFEARLTRSRRVVAVGPADELAAAIGTVIDLVSPSGDETATARLVGIGRTWTEQGTERAYGYLDATSISAGAA